MIVCKLRKDRFVSPDNVKYKSYGIDAYEGKERVKIIKDISLSKQNLKQFIKQCEAMNLQELDEAIQVFVEKELEVIVVKPRFI